jgi:hypothetical protein
MVQVDHAAHADLIDSTELASPLLSTSAGLAMRW